MHFKFLMSYLRGLLFVYVTKTLQHRLDFTSHPFCSPRFPRVCISISKNIPHIRRRPYRNPFNPYLCLPDRIFCLDQDANTRQSRSRPFRMNNTLKARWEIKLMEKINWLVQEKKTKIQCSV